MQALTVTSLADSCFDPSIITKFAVTLNWRQLFAMPPNHTAIGGITIVPASISQSRLAFAPNTGLLNIAPFALVPGYTYIFQFELTGTITTISTTVPVYTAAYMALSVQQSALIARISGSDHNVFVGAGAPLKVLDARSSFDPDSQVRPSLLNTRLYILLTTTCFAIIHSQVPSAGLSYSWACQRSVTLLPCFNSSLSAALAVARSSATLTLSPELLVASFNDSFAFQVW